MGKVFELVVPAYNESKNLEILIARVKEAAETAGYSSSDFTLVVVENGSSDDSSEVLENLGRGTLKSWFRVVRIGKNQGYGFGLWSGLKETAAPYVGWSHADLQCDAKDAFRALSLVKSSNEKILVKGVRSGRNWKDQFVSRIFETLARLILGVKVYEMNAQPKVFRRELLDRVSSPPLTFAFDLYVLYKAQQAGYIFKEISVLFPPRIHGVSKWASAFLSRYKTILGMIRYMFDLKKKEGRI